MRIEKLYIRGFGKLEDFTLELSEGLNVMYGPNESGKSTIMAFVKAVFYGLQGGRTGNDGLDSGIKRYMPWNGGQYGGYINFRLDNGEAYRIDRSFDKGTVKLYDGDFNDITGRFTGAKDTAGLGEKLLGINESLFERTVYVKQAGTRIDTSASKDLIDRISNIRQSGAEDISYKNANAALREALKSQVGTDRSYTRPLDIINERLEELCGIKDRRGEEYQRLQETLKESEELELDIGRFAEKDRLFSKIIEFCGLMEKKKAINERNDQVHFLNAGIKQSRKNVEDMTRDRSALELELENNTETMKALAPDQEKDIPNRTAEIKRYKTRLRALTAAGIFSLAALLGTIWGSIFMHVLAPFTAAIPAVLLALAGILRLKAGKSLERLKEEQAELSANSERQSRQAGNLQRMNDVLDRQIAGIAERLLTETTQYEQLVKRLENINAGSGQGDLSELDKRLDLISEDIPGLMDSTGKYLTLAEREQAEAAVENPCESTCMEIRRLKELNDVRIQQMRLRKAALDQMVKTGGSDYDDRALEAEILKLTGQKRSLEQRGEALNIAIRTLEEASGEVQKKYLPVMNKVLGGTFSCLTSDKYSDVRPGDGLNIMLSDPVTETVIPVGALSGGAIDQLYLALRIAISETVLKINESLPFIMDEPFAQYDDARIANALKSIYEISKKQQVVIFTCKGREADMAGSEFPCKICSLT